MLQTVKVDPLLQDRFGKVPGIGGLLTAETDGPEFGVGQR